MRSLHLKLLVTSELKEGSHLQQEWDDLVAKNPASGFMQSSSWAMFKRKQGFRTIHLLISNGEALVGGAVGYLAPESARIGSVVIPHGPVLPWDDALVSSCGLKLLVDKLRQLSSELEMSAVRIQPALAPPVAPALREFRRSPYDILPDQTAYLDLSHADNELLANMHHKCRYNIRLAERHGVTVREAVLKSDIQSFYSIMQQASARDDFYLEPLCFFQDLFASLPPSMVRLLIAEHEGNDLAAAFLISFGGCATYLYGGTSGQKRNLMAGYAVQWEAMKAAKAMGCHTYDFYGYVSPFDTSHPYAQFSKFKQKFGAQPMRFIGAHDLAFVENLTKMVIGAIKELEHDAPLIVSNVPYSQRNRS